MHVTIDYPHTPTAGAFNVFNLDEPTPAAGLATLTRVATIPTVANLIATPAGVATSIVTEGDTPQDSGLVVNVNASGLGAGGTDAVVGNSLGVQSVNVDAGGRLVDVATSGVVAVAGTPGLLYAGVEAVNVVNAADYPLTPVPAVVFATEGTPLVNTNVGGFTDSDPSATVALYTAAINWGDGSTPTPGTVVARTGGGFTVLGSHTYAQSGTLPITVGVLDAPSTDVVNFDGVTVRVTDLGARRPSTAPPWSHRPSWRPRACRSPGSRASR